MKKIALLAALSASIGFANADSAIRLDPVYTTFGQLTGGWDFYFSDNQAIGVNLFSSADRGKLGLRYTHHWNLETSSNWLMVADLNLIAYRGNDWVYDNEDYYTGGEEVVYEHLAGELRLMQQYRWQWNSGFNTTLGLGAFAIVDPKQKYEPWFAMQDHVIPAYGMGEWTVGWRF